jgi:lipid A 3-O-deacylase
LSHVRYTETYWIFTEKVAFVKSKEEEKSLYIRRIFIFFLWTKLLCATPPPDLISFAAGAFNVLRPASMTAEFEAEYKFLLKCLKSPWHFLEFRPLVGVMMTAKGSGYLYGGLNFDLLFGDHCLIAPGFAAGYYWRGDGKDLGFPLEFRSGVELAWQFSDGRRLGIHFYHLSNASLAKRNPGEESLVLYYDIPITKGFPFQTK